MAIIKCFYLKKPKLWWRLKMIIRLVSVENNECITYEQGMDFDAFAFFF